MGLATGIEMASRVDKARLLQALLRQKAQAAKARYLAPAEAPFVRDAVLDPGIRPCGAAQQLTGASAVLLTGATGFLGAHLLHDLCHLTNATIYCLVRAESIEQARERLEENVRQYTGSGLPAGRIVPVIGDLANPRLGLSAAGFEQLAGTVEVIVHNGAMLNHLAGYDRLRAANVMSTADLLRLAGSKRPKWINYVSSMIAATDRDCDGALLEQLPAGDPSEITGGYAQSKWVSEKLLAEARTRGFGVTVYRPGIIAGRRDTGAWAAAHDHLLLLLKSCLQLGYAPESSLLVDLTPVDFVSEAVVRLSLVHPEHPVIHLSNPNAVPWADIVAWMNEFGHSLRMVPFDVWQKRHLARIDESNALFPLLPVYLEETGIGKRELQVAKMARARHDFTAPLLDGAGLEYPAVDRQLFRKYVGYCMDRGFFPPARKGASV